MTKFYFTDIQFETEIQSYFFFCFRNRCYPSGIFLDHTEKMSRMHARCFNEKEEI